MGGGGLGHKARSLDWSGAARDHVIMCESIGVERAAVVVEPAVFGWVTVDGKMHSGRRKSQNIENEAHREART